MLAGSMRVLVVGAGGREHALVWKIAQSPLVKEVFAAPGNAGMAALATCVPIGVADVVELADFAEAMRIDLTVIGPELPLSLGLVDELAKRGLAAFGPNKIAAELEGSKVFSKTFMQAHGIPTAEAVVCGNRAEAEAALKKLGLPAVFKADGLPWPTRGLERAGRAEVYCTSARGFSVLLWSDGELGYALVSDVDAQDLALLASKRASPA